MYYILNDDHSIRPVDDVLEWGKWFQTADRHVEKTKRDGVLVSTVFLGLDHSFLAGDADPPIVFETMVFTDKEGHPYEEYTERYSTWDEAQAGHRRICEMVFGEEDENSTS